MVILQNTSALTRNMHEYLGVTYLDICNFLSKYNFKKLKKITSVGKKEKKMQERQREKLV